MTIMIAAVAAASQYNGIDRRLLVVRIHGNLIASCRSWAMNECPVTVE